jgi:cytochrome c oxidase subunit IV
MDSDERKTPVNLRAKTHGIVWAGLVLLTGISVAMAKLNPGGAAIIACLVIAALQATLVLLYFMDLLREKRLLIKLMVPITIITLTIFIGITFVDVITR